MNSATLLNWDKSQSSDDSVRKKLRPINIWKNFAWYPQRHKSLANGIIRHVHTQWKKINSLQTSVMFISKKKPNGWH